MAYDSEGFKPNGVNVAECLRVADEVEAASDFEMRHTHHDCGSPACIAGRLVGKIPIKFGYMMEGWHQMRIFREAAAALGIDSTAMWDLFAPFVEDVADVCAWPGELGFITSAHAAACLRHLAATGEVDWLSTKPDQAAKAGS